ncbi:MAG: phosphatidate cytidylyltransferase [Clostridia bacterium]
MKTRIAVGIVLVLLLVAILYFGGYVLLTVISLFSLIAVYEVGLAFKNKGYQPMLIPAYVFAASFGFVYHAFGLFSMVVLYVASIMATMISSLFSKKRTTVDVIPALFVHVYPLMLLMCLLLVYYSFDRTVALTASCLAYGAPEFADTLAYFGGTLFGKHKLCPSISPKKTIEGSVCALIGGVAFGGIMIALQQMWGGSVHVVVLLLLGLGCGVFSQFGDLFASTIKRWSGIKDFSSLFPAHGGIMDRIDSILFCSPLILCVFTILTKLGIY